MEEQGDIKLRIHSCEADISKTMSFSKNQLTLQCILNINNHFRVVGVSSKTGGVLFRPNDQSFPPKSTATTDGAWLDNGKKIGTFGLRDGDLLFLTHKQGAGSPQQLARSPSAQPTKKSTFWEGEDEKVKFLVTGRKNRNEAAMEIVTTEQTYFTNLTLMLEVFVRPLRQHKNYLSLPAAEKFNSLFSLLETFHGFHSHFLQQLEERTRHSSSQKMDSLGDVIIQLSPFLKIYGEYCIHYDKFNSDVRSILFADPVLGPFIMECEASPKLNHQKWGDYFIQPVQRIPRYRLLIEALLKYTPKEHSDYVTLSAARDKIIEVAEMVNSYKDKTTKMLDLAEQIVGLPFPLLTGNRFLLLEGDMRKNPVSSGGPLMRKKARRFFLFNDLLLYTEHNQKKKVFQFKGALHLHPDEYSVVQLADTTFQIRGSKKDLNVFTNSKEETMKWVETLNTILSPDVSSIVPGTHKGTISLNTRKVEETAKQKTFLRRMDPSRLSIRKSAGSRADARRLPEEGNNNSNSNNSTSTDNNNTDNNTDNGNSADGSVMRRDRHKSSIH